MPLQILSGSASPFLTSGRRVQRATRLKTTVLRSVGGSSAAAREGSQRDAFRVQERDWAEHRRGSDAPFLASTLRGSMASGMRPRRWARTSSWTMDVLFQM